MSRSSATPLRLCVKGSAIAANWRALNQLSGNGAACGAAVKANGYGLGASEIVRRLQREGCRDFYVATWQEAAELEDVISEASLTVLNGVLESDMPLALSIGAKPMLNSAAQLERWRETGRPCDVMIDTGMNRLGIGVSESSSQDWEGLQIDVLASHLASADEDSAQNASQMGALQSVVQGIPHRRVSLANSAGIALGADFAFDLTRPGLSLYGGVPRSELKEIIQPVGHLEARILQIRDIDVGDKVGYNATFIADAPMRIAIASIGYADGYLRGYSSRGCYFADAARLPVIGRVSMDLIAVTINQSPDLNEGDWIGMPLDLPSMSAQSGLSQYEVITGLGNRFERAWVD